jgi:hypothetical protein
MQDLAETKYRRLCRARLEPFFDAYSLLEPEVAEPDGSRYPSAIRLCGDLVRTPPNNFCM